MTRTRRLSTGVDWWELSTTRKDWQEADPALLATMLGQVHLIRAFEETALDLASRGLLHGPAHSSIGQEGGAVGSALSLRPTDAVNGSHRGHHQFLAKSLGYVTGGTLDLEHLVTDPIQSLLQRTLAEILGLDQGFSHGRGGSMHLQWLEAGALGTNAIVGGGLPIATGNAFAQKRAGTDDLTINYFGDGASQIGSVLEGMNLAAAWKLPVGFFIENNLYAVSTHASEITADPRFSVRGQGFGIPSWRVDGMDPLAVHLATLQASEQMRAGEGPAIIEAEVYRFFHQNGPFPGSAFGYRTKDEEKEWRARDPLERVATEMTRLGLIDADGVRHVREQAVHAMSVVLEALLEDDPERSGRQRIRPELWPSPEYVNVGLRSDGTELDGLRAGEPAEPPADAEPRRFVEVIAEVMDRRMGEDERIFVLGEDVHHLGGGTNGATKNLIEHHGEDRVLGTPISENEFFGLALGVALDGRYRPVVEFMYPDFLWVAADQVFNQAGKVRHMFGDNNTVPLVLRTKVAMGSGYGSQHLMDPAGIFATAPGWRIVAASTPGDYIGLMNAALALEDPVLVIEHMGMYDQKFPVDTSDLDFIIPPGTARTVRSGQDVTILTYLSMVQPSLDAAELTDVDAEVIDLRWLDAASLDWERIEESIRRTNNVLIVEQGARGTSYGGWLADELQRRCFDWLDQPIQRVTGGEASPSISKVLEAAALADTSTIAARLTEMKTTFGEQP